MKSRMICWETQKIEYHCAQKDRDTNHMAQRFLSCFVQARVNPKIPMKIILFCKELQKFIYFMLIAFLLWRIILFLFTVNLHCNLLDFLFLYKLLSESQLFGAHILVTAIPLKRWFVWTENNLFHSKEIWFQG